MLTLRATTGADVLDVAGWEADGDTAVWLGETGRFWHERALADPDQKHLIAEDAGTWQDSSSLRECAAAVLSNCAGWSYPLCSGASAVAGSEGFTPVRTVPGGVTVPDGRVAALLIMTREVVG